MNCTTSPINFACSNEFSVGEQFSNQSIAFLWNINFQLSASGDALRPLKYTLFSNFSFWPHAGRAVPFLLRLEEKELKDSFTHSFFQFAAISFTISGTRHLVISWPHFGSSFASLPCGSTSHDRAKSEKISLLVHIRACSIHIWKICELLVFALTYQIYAKSNFWLLFLPYSFKSQK